jgi:hypothetical protein
MDRVLVVGIIFDRGSSMDPIFWEFMTSSLSASLGEPEVRP